MNKDQQPRKISAKLLKGGAASLSQMIIETGAQDLKAQDAANKRKEEKKDA